MGGSLRCFFVVFSLSLTYDPLFLGGEGWFLGGGCRNEDVLAEKARKLKIYVALGAFGVLFFIFTFLPCGENTRRTLMLFLTNGFGVILAWKVNKTRARVGLMGKVGWFIRHECWSCLCVNEVLFKLRNSWFTFYPLYHFSKKALIIHLRQMKDILSV